MRREVEVKTFSVEIAAADALSVQVDEGVFVVHREGGGLEFEPVMDQILAEFVLFGETHRAEFTVHAACEPAIGVDTPAEPVARFEQSHFVSGFFEQKSGGQSGHPRADDEDVFGMAGFWL